MKNESDVTYGQIVTHTRNVCSAINPSKVHTHSKHRSEHTHTVNTAVSQVSQDIHILEISFFYRFRIFLKTIYEWLTNMHYNKIISLV